MATFAERLKNLRSKNGMTQKEVADKLGISESAYGYYEQGRRQPPQEAYGILSELYEVSLDYLILGINKSTNDSLLTGTERTIDEKLKEVMSDPYAVVMFNDFKSATAEEKEMFIEIWNSIKKRSKDK